MSIEEKNNRMLEHLNELLNKNPLDLDKYISERIKYAKFCYKHSLAPSSDELNEKILFQYFIIPSAPLRYNISDEKKENAFTKIREHMALTPEEASTILESVVEIARQKLSQYDDLDNSPLDGSCGLGQGFTYYPLQELGVHTTVNRATNLPDSYTNHGFLTCFLPVIEDGQVVTKQYLIDITYRQFFTYFSCDKSRFYDGKLGYRGETTPNPGYFLSQFRDGIQFSKELLTKGYIELTEKNARLYGLGFSCTSLSFHNKKRKKEIMNHTGREYLDAINNPSLQSNIDYRYDELYEYDELPILYRGTCEHKVK